MQNKTRTLEEIKTPNVNLIMSKSIKTKIYIQIYVLPQDACIFFGLNSSIWET